MPRPNMISGNYNYLGVGGHYKSGIAGLGNVSQAELDNVGLTIGEWQHMLAHLNDDAAYGPGGYNTPGLIKSGMSTVGFRGLGSGYTIPYGTAVDIFKGNLSIDTPTGMENNGFLDYMQSVQGFESNPAYTYYPGGENVSTLGYWIKANWKMLLVGAGAAMVLLPRGRR